jgi:arylsulfatase A-like enzyme/tetratricopeptide (TPR) repeat protein
MRDKGLGIRWFALLGGLAAVVAVVWFWPLRREPAEPVFAKTPDQNVLLITIDTLRADALGSYGGRAATPNLDALARDGVRFAFAHAHAVVTLPSHATILTGRYPFDHAVRDNAGFSLDDSVQTLAEAARAKGFAAGGFVGAFPVDARFGLSQGFDVYEDLGGREVAPSDFAFSERPAAEVVALAAAWIEQQQKAWLAWVHVFDPHSPYAPPPPFDAQYAGDPYAGEVAYTDSALGPLLDLARRSGRPTTVIVTADHGEGLGEHGEPTHGVFAYESTLRVPLILAQVGGTEAAERSEAASAKRARERSERDARGGGAPRALNNASGVVTKPDGFVSNTPVRHIDIVPTIADLTGISMDGELPGRTLLTAFGDNGEPRPMYFEAMTAMLKRGWAPLRGVISGREKYIDLPVEELYDLGVDPKEARNLAASSAERVRVLTAQLRGFGETLPGDQASENAEVRARLQSLGYLSGSAPRKAHYTEEDDPKRLIDVDRLMIQGIELHRAGRAAEAMDAYRRVIARRPDMELAYRRLAYIQWEAGATRDAMATLSDSLAKNGPDIDTEVRLGTYLAESGSVADALPILERAAKADPENTEALNALGIAYARSGRAADALATFNRILRINPRDAFALENIGAVHLQRGNARAARDAFSTAVQNDPRSSRAHAGLGVVALQRGDRNAAIEHWRRAVQLDPRNFDALYNVGTELANAGRLDEARPYLERFVRTAPPAFYSRDIARIREVLR